MANLITIPAMLDPHVHLRDMDWSHKADFTTETAAAVAGGYWAVFDMPNTSPSTVDRTTLDRKLAEIDTNAICDYGIYFGAKHDKANDAHNATQFPAIIDDVCGLKIFNNATTGDLLIEDQTVRRQMYAAWPRHKPISVHAEGTTILDILALVRKTRQRTHFLHISTAEEIGYLRDAKEEGLPVTIGVCPHHLWLTQEDLPVLKGFGLMKPELKTKADRDALWRAVQDDLVDIIESDHAPHTIEEKRSDNPPYGVPGLETTLPLLLTAVHEGRLSLERVVDLVSQNPRRIFNVIAPPATYARIDLDITYTVNRARLKTKCAWSPFDGMVMHGAIVETWIRGTQVYDGERILVEPGFGANLYAR